MVIIITIADSNRGCYLLIRQDLSSFVPDKKTRKILGYEHFDYSMCSWRL